MLNAIGEDAGEVLAAMFPVLAAMEGANKVEEVEVEVEAEEEEAMVAVAVVVLVAVVKVKAKGGREAALGDKLRGHPCLLFPEMYAIPSGQTGRVYEDLAVASNMRQPREWSLQRFVWFPMLSREERGTVRAIIIYSYAILNYTHY